MKKHRGNKHLIVRADSNLHAKLGRLVANTGADKSTCVRFALQFLNEDQLTQLISAQRGQQQRVVQHAP